MERIYRKNNFRICTYTPVRIRYVSLFDPCTDMQRRTRAFGIQGFKRFYIVHNIALPFMAGMMVVRGILQVLNVNLTHAADAAISGIAGVSHILITISLILFFIMLKKYLIKEK